MNQYAEYTNQNNATSRFAKPEQRNKQICQTRTTQQANLPEAIAGQHFFSSAKAYSELTQISKMKFFAKIFNGQKSLTIFAKISI